MAEKLYSRKEMLEITGEKNQRVQYLALKGVFTPADKGKGKGTARKYSVGNLLEILLVQSIAPFLNNVDFIMCILDQVRKENPSYFAISDDEGLLGNDECILSVLFMSQNDIIVYVHGLEEAKEVMGRYLPTGFKSFEMDLNVLKRMLFEQIETMR